jgi:hypothetical protein
MRESSFYLKNHHRDDLKRCPLPLSAAMRRGGIVSEVASILIVSILDRRSWF